MLRRRVLALGWGRLPPPCDGIPFRSIAFDALSSALGNSSTGAVLLLGDAALRAIDPHDIAALAPSPTCILIGVLDARDDALVARWSRATEMTFATREALAIVLHEAVQTPLRPGVDPKDWMPAISHGPRPTAHGPRPTAHGPRPLGAPSRRLSGSSPTFAR